MDCGIDGDNEFDIATLSYTLTSCWIVALSSPWLRRNAFSAAVLDISNSFI